MSGSSMKKRWYVVQAFSGFEGRVAQSLKEHIKMHNMEELFGEVLVPTEEVVEMRVRPAPQRTQVLSWLCSSSDDHER